MDEYLTKDRIAELKEELDKLKTERRPEVAKRLKRAKELGDLSENSEYQEAREEQQRVERRLSEVESLLRGAHVIEKPTSGNVAIGSTIRVSRNSKESIFTIVGPNEARPEAGLISHASPIGTAFLNCKPGDVVKVRTPSGEAEYKIIAIE